MRMYGIGRSAVIAAVGCLVAAQLGIGVAQGAGTPDAWITAKTKMALLTTDGVPSTAINVDTVDGRVTLHGKVNSAAEKDAAGAAAKKIDGVKEVRNLLQIVPEGAVDQVTVADADVKNQVQKALAADKTIADSDIEVESVNDGMVLLGGTAKSLEDHLRALEIARGVAGVRRVSTEVRSPDKLADAELREDRKENIAGDSEPVTDAWITSAVKMRLLANSETPALDINVDTNHGDVTLFGMVPTQASKAAAEAEAQKTSGVNKVRNELQVVAKAMQDKVEVKDDALKTQVNEAIDQRDLKDANINVEVSNGIVRLSGTVPSTTDRLTAAIAARSIPGVRSVRDDLKIQPRS